MHTKKTVQFLLDLSKCRAHLFKVTMLLDGASPSQYLSLPVWTPGSYMVREFAQHIVVIQALENDRFIAVSKVNKNTFALDNQGNSVVVNYDVYGFDLSIRAAFIDHCQAFFNGTALFLRPHHGENIRFLVNIMRPSGVDFQNWRVATNMPKVDIDSLGFGTYSAESFAELVDYPFQISELKRLYFTASNIPHEMVLVGDVRSCDEERLTKDLTKLCEEHLAMYGNAPFMRYLFIARFEEGGYGGLEHRNSSMLLFSPYGLPKKGLGEPDNNYQIFLSLCSHEYFHAWNVKQLMPHNFVSYDFDHECYTTMLWIFEGITSYYDDLLVKRSGLISLSSYLELMGRNYGKLLRNRGRLVQSVAESSFDAWIKFYRQNENSPNSSVSYYLKGSFIALYLDLLIRVTTGHKASLDDVMKVAFEGYGKGSGIKESEFFELLRKIGKIDSEEFKAKYIYGKDELPIGEMLNQFGIDFSLMPDELYIDDKTKMQAYLGLKLHFDDRGRAIVTFVELDGPAMISGLSPKDEVIAINKIRLDPSNAPKLLGALQVKEPIEVTYSRRTLLKNCFLIPHELPTHICKLSVKQKIVAIEQSCLAAWLGHFSDSL
jgi:predicted metalloprotease with PDZ domain